MRSTLTVTSAVITNTTASDLVEPSTARTVDGSIMRHEVTISTPASAASGMCETTVAPTSTIASKSRPCTIAATRVRAPARMLTAVRAMAPVAGRPPKRPEASDARPCPTSSRSAS